MHLTYSIWRNNGACDASAQDVAKKKVAQFDVGKNYYVLFISPLPILKKITKMHQGKTPTSIYVSMLNYCVKVFLHDDHWYIHNEKKMSRSDYVRVIQNDASFLNELRVLRIYHT